jgi:hypothetical protein
MAPFASEESDEEKVKPWRLERVPPALVNELEGFVLYRSSPINRQRGTHVPMRQHSVTPLSQHCHAILQMGHVSSSARWGPTSAPVWRSWATSPPNTTSSPGSACLQRWSCRRGRKRGSVHWRQKSCGTAQWRIVRFSSSLPPGRHAIAVTSVARTHRRYELAHLGHKLCIQHLQGRRRCSLRSHHAAGRIIKAPVRASPWAARFGCGILF